ncbi:MAG: NUDIX domain-containing protein [Bacilli bacterium]|nr:NUDIX domain-containing protein [Bacilli bacterium]
MNLICKLTDEDIGENYVELNNPLIRMSARGIVIRNDGKIAIFHKLLKNEYKLPGGGIENDETPEDAFKREVLEETGCVVEIIEKLGLTEEYKYKTNFKQISNVFIGKVIEDTKKLSVTQKEKDEGAQLLWESPQNALLLIQDSFNKVVASKYESVYMTKFIVLRDQKILEYYLDKENI